MAAVRSEVQVAPWTDAPLTFDHDTVEHQNLLAMGVVPVDMGPFGARCHLDDPGTKPVGCRQIAPHASGADNDRFHFIGVNNRKHGAIPCRQYRANLVRA